MGDEFVSGVLGFCLAWMVVAMVLVFRSWQQGQSRDTLPHDEEATTEPDLHRAIVEYQLFDASKRVLAHVVPMAQLAASMPKARWRMASGDGAGSVGLPMRDGFFLDAERLDIAVRAYEGAELSMHDQAVLAGVAQPNRFGSVEHSPPLATTA